MLGENEKSRRVPVETVDEGRSRLSAPFDCNVAIGFCNERFAFELFCRGREIPRLFVDDEEIVVFEHQAKQVAFELFRSLGVAATGIVRQNELIARSERPSGVS